MAQTAADPDDLRQLARKLQDFCETTREKLQSIRAQLDELGNSSWRDQRQKEFSVAFEDVSSRLTISLADFDPMMVQHLEKLARILDEFERA